LILLSWSLQRNRQYFDFENYHISAASEDQANF
jgi:hypothetical protein